MSIKLSKRVKSKLPMVRPGLRDNSILPSSGGASNSGITLDYSAINIGGVDTGIPYNHADDDLPTIKDMPILQELKAVKAPDFRETGIYLVETSRGTKKIYRDPENREWYEDVSGKHYSQSWLGSTKQEALDRLSKLYADVIATNEADDDEEEGEEYKAIDLTSNWWVADHRIKLHSKLWESAKALLWPWINKVQLTRIKQNDDGTWQEVHKIVDAEDTLILLPLESHEANDLYSKTRETPSALNTIPTETYNNSYVGTREDGFEFRHSLEARLKMRAVKLGGILNIPQYSDPNMYEQVGNIRNTMEPELTTFDDMGPGMAENRMAGYADDEPKPTFNKRHWFDWQAHRSNFYGSNGIGLLENELPIALNPKTSEGDIKEWIASFQVRFGIPTKLFPVLKGMIDVMRGIKYDEWNDDDAAPFYQLLRQYAMTDTEWVEHNTSAIETMDDDVVEAEDEEMGKKAFPDYVQWNSSPMYEQVTEKQDYEMTPSFDMWNVHATDDKMKRPAPFLGNYKGSFADSLLDILNADDYGAEVEYFDEPDGDGHRYAIYVHDPMKVLETIRQQNPEFEREFRFMMDLPDIVEAIDDTELLHKQAFIKAAVTYDSNPVIQDLVKIPAVKALIDQQASGFVDKIIVTTPSADIATTQQQSGVKLEPISGNPYGHVFVSEDPITHQKKPLDKIVRIDRITDAWGTLSVMLHEICHARHPEWSEAQVEAEAQRNADTVKQFLTPKAAKKKILFVKSNLQSLPTIECDLADTYQKQVIGLQNHTALHPRAGMIFPYHRPQALSFHMGKVSFPIDIIFTDANNTILKICRNCQPNSSDIYSCSNASKVIEVVGSFCAFHDLDVGDQVFDAADNIYKQEDFSKYILQALQRIKVEQQKQLDMKEWNIKIVMKQEPDSRRFLKVSWTPEDYMFKKADILVNPDPLLITTALKKMPLDKLVRHSLLHILAGAKNELPEDREQELITSKLFEGSDG